MTNSSITATQVTRPTQRLKSTDEKIEELKQHFAENAIKMDFMRKSDGFNYVMGYVGMDPENSEWRIWKTMDDSVNRSHNSEYIHSGLNRLEATEKFKEITG